MKSIVTILISILTATVAVAQSGSIRTIFQNEAFQLNSGGRSLLGGKSRTYISVPIPEGTVALLYTVKSSVSADVGQNIKLAAEVTAALSGHVGIANAIDRVNLPPSNAVIDVFVLPGDDTNLYNFLNKKDGVWVQYTDYACESSLGCKRMVRVSPQMNKVFIALRNPSAINRIVAIVDVVAIIKN